MVTETQFNDAMSRIFLRFDETDETIDRSYKQLRASIDHVGTKLDEFKEEMTKFKLEMQEFTLEMKALNKKMDERMSRLEDIEASR